MRGIVAWWSAPVVGTLPADRGDADPRAGLDGDALPDLLTRHQQADLALRDEHTLRVIKRGVPDISNVGAAYPKFLYRRAPP